MVGVPGKYKGCNTCRARRVKCDNERPYCRKCSDSGRQCQGYEREIVFIVGTLEDKGRCSSHPPRNVKSPNNTPSPPRTAGEEPAVHITPARPLRSAWDNAITISKSGSNQQLRIIALHTSLSATVRHCSDASRANKISLPPYTPVDIQPRFGSEDFWLSSQCLAHVPTSQEGMLLYLHEQNAPLACNTTGSASWEGPAAQSNKIRYLEPGHFATFPAHHFFVRVYRPAAIVAALLDRRPTFCGDPEWVTASWERHPKAPFDRLLDILSQIPPLLQRLDQLLVLEPTVNRRHMAQDLLANCVSINGALEQWHAMVHQTSYNTQSPYWMAPDQQNAQPPFAGALAFRDQLTSITFLYYWAAQVLFYPCIELLSHTIFTPVIDAYDPAQMYPELPPHLNIDPQAYGPNRTREIAVNVCRGLDAALAVSTQPDLLAFPVHVVESLYGGLNVVAQTGDGTMELMWLGGFRGRLMLKGQGLADAVMARSFANLAEW
ncbi:unnamed protein product [Discula destructiva]